MKKEKDAPAADAGVPSKLVTPPDDKAKAGKWFERARELGAKRQFDHAIEYYVEGVGFWPDAVEEALKPLHGCAVARKQTGGKKPGLKDTMKRSMSDKDPKQGMINALWLFGHDPDNVGYIEGAARAAGKLRAEAAAQWAAGVWMKTLEGAAKVSGKQFQGLVDFLDEAGERAAARSDGVVAVSLFQMAVEAVNLWRRKVGKEQAAENALKQISTKLTIHKGKYQDNESFRDSMRESAEQRDLHDENRTVQSDERFDELVEKAEREYLKDPADAIAMKKYVDMLCRREREGEELKAIGVLVNEYKRSSQYRWKQLADDIRMRQFSRKEREIRAGGDAESIKEHQIATLRFELGVFKERTEKYPTDLRIKFDYAIRNFKAGRFDDAIPLLQAARNDPKNRAACSMYLGRCFYRKGYFSQAVSALQEAYEGQEGADDDTTKTIMYWLALSQEAAGNVEAARKTYGQILQMDYNFKDVRAKLDALPRG